MPELAARDDTIRILLVDGHRVVADALTRMIDAEPDLSVILHAASLAELVAATVPDFDVALTRFLLPDGNGVDSTRMIKRRWPSSKVVVLSAVTDPHAVSRVRRAGADAFVGRDETADQLLDALRLAHSGKTRIVIAASGAKRRSKAGDKPAGTNHDLTQRELEVLQALDRGRTSRQICAEMGIAQNTLRTHVQKIISKLHVNSRLEAVALARREEIV